MRNCCLVESYQTVILDLSNGWTSVEHFDCQVPVIANDSCVFFVPGHAIRRVFFCKILAPIIAYHLHWHGTGTTFLRLHPSSKGPKKIPKKLKSFVKDFSPKISLKSLPEILALRKNGRVLKNFGAKVTLYVFLLNVFSMLFSRFYRGGLVVLHEKNGAFEKPTNDTGIVLKIIRF